MAMNVGGGGKPGRIRPEMNVTPLVDVVLVLLIIFMVVMPLMSQKFWLQVPKEPEPDTPPPAADAKPPPVLYLDTTGALTLNSQPLVFGPEFDTRIERAAAATADGVIFFDAADDADYAAAVEVMDKVKAAGANVAILPDGLKTQAQPAEAPAQAPASAP